MGAYEKARSCPCNVDKFGRPIAEFQLVQDLPV